MQAALHEVAQGSANAAGAAGLQFQPVGSGEVWTGSISIPAAAPLSTLPITWTAYDDGNPIGSWYNNQASGTLQARGTVKVIGSGVGPGILAAYFLGVATDTATAPPWWPSPTPAPPPATPKQIVSNAVPLGTTVTQIGSDQPVVVGTGLEIFECAIAPFGGGPGGAARLQILWSIDGSFVDPVEYDFDITLNANMRGLVLPHLAPFVRFNAIRSAGATQMSLTVFTGLPPIVRPPVVAQGILAFSSGPFAAGSTSFVLPPYVGPAMLSGEMVGTANKFEIVLTSNDYQGNFIGSTFAIDSTLDPNGVRIIPPVQVFIPPAINTLKVVNGNGAQEAGDFQLVSLGP